MPTIFAEVHHTDEKLVERVTEILKAEGIMFSQAEGAEVDVIGLHGDIASGKVKPVKWDLELLKEGVKEKGAVINITLVDQTRINGLDVVVNGLEELIGRDAFNDWMDEIGGECHGEMIDYMSEGAFMLFAMFGPTPDDEVLEMCRDGLIQFPNLTDTVDVTKLFTVEAFKVMSRDMKYMDSISFFTETDTGNDS